MRNSINCWQVGGTVDLELRISEDKSAAAAANRRAETAQPTETQDLLLIIYLL